MTRSKRKCKKPIDYAVWGSSDDSEGDTESQPEGESSHPSSSYEDEPEGTPAPESMLEESQAHPEHTHNKP